MPAMSSPKTTQRSDRTRKILQVTLSDETIAKLRELSEWLNGRPMSWIVEDEIVRAHEREKKKRGGP